MTSPSTRDCLDAAARTIGLSGEEFAEIAESFSRAWDAPDEPAPPFTEADVERLLQADWDERGHAKMGRVVTLNPAHKGVVASWYPRWRLAWTMYDATDGVHQSEFAWRPDSFHGCERADVVNDFGHVAYVIDSRILPNVVQVRGENEDIDGPPHQELVFGEKP